MQSSKKKKKKKNISPVVSSQRVDLAVSWQLQRFSFNPKFRLCVLEMK